jgi:hypothetical protein
MEHGGRGGAVGAGSREPERELPPEELFDKLEPFKRLVAEDIREGGERSGEQ